MAEELKKKKMEKIKDIDKYLAANAIRQYFKKM
jgi:hypothetical protein